MDTNNNNNNRSSLKRVQEDIPGAHDYWPTRPSEAYPDRVHMGDVTAWCMVSSLAELIDGANAAGFDVRVKDVLLNVQVILSPRQR